MKLQWSLLAPAGLLIVSGLVILSSTSEHLFYLQLLWVGVGTTLATAIIWFDWRPLAEYPWFPGIIYLGGVFLLILTYIFAPVVRGNRAWLYIGPFGIQAAEFMKLGLILVYAYFLRSRHIVIARFSTIAKSALLLIVPAGIVTLQPDLGSALVMLAIWFGLLLTSGLPWRYMGFAAIVGILVIFLAWNFFLHDYQKDRIIGLLFPESDPLGVNYSVIQSKIAIGSAGWFGKGYGQGTQVQLGFLPEASSDFIFSAFTEEWGLAGAALLVVSFTALTFGILKTGVRAETNLEKFICLGTAILFVSHFFVNVGSALGLFPVIGVPFPFVSYGGSNFAVSSMLFGLVYSIRARYD